MHPSLIAIRDSLLGTSYEGDLWLVGGAVRDELLGAPPKSDFDLVITGNAPELAGFLYRSGLSSIDPVTYERFGTAMLIVDGSSVELVTARRESYAEDSRKPTVEPATYAEDALRRDFTVNTLMKNLFTEELRDPLGRGLDDLKNRILRTPLDPMETFYDDPLRMLRAIRFRWKLGFEPVPGLYEAIRQSKERLRIVSFERIRDELVKMVDHGSAPDALHDVMSLGLAEIIAPEWLPMVGCEQGKYHHLDVWDHSLLVLRHVGPEDRVLALAAILHDVGKPPTRTVDSEGNTRFFSHETVGADLAKQVLRRLRFSEKEVVDVATLVKNHMRLGSSPSFSASAARRVLRDLGDLSERLLALVDADTRALKPGVRVMDLAAIRERIREVQVETPAETLESPLSGTEIMEELGLKPGPEVGHIKALLSEQVLEGALKPNDREGAIEYLQELRTIVKEPGMLPTSGNRKSGREGK